jgi:predicted GIY-YIG superfamily endonuclease
MRHWVYMLRCYKGSEMKCHYVGRTNNILRRMNQHQKNVKEKRVDKFTGRFDYVELVWLKVCEDLEESKEIEMSVKKYTYEQKVELVGNVIL